MYSLFIRDCYTTDAIPQDDITQSRTSNDTGVSLLAIFDRGIYLPELDVWLDSLRKKDTCIVSHAHSDHIARHIEPILTTESSLLLDEYYKKSSPISLPYYQTHAKGNYTITFYPAGHCLGSAQTLIQSLDTGEKILYTGDFKTRFNDINKPFEFVPCDTLIIESTYGNPEYTFPDPAIVLDIAVTRLIEWLNQGIRPVINSWKLGKSQEILHHLQLAGLNVFLEQSVYDITVKYVESGVAFPGSINLFTGDSWPEESILICPPGKASFQLTNHFTRIKFMELTGWSVNPRRSFSRRVDVSLPYSDHADFNELVELVSTLNPKQTYTVNGFPELSQYLRNQGHPSIHLGQAHHNQDKGYQMKLI